jgi:hypothetical protein
MDMVDDYSLQFNLNTSQTIFRIVREYDQMKKWSYYHKVKEEKTLMGNESKESFEFNEVSTGELIDSPKFQEEQSKKHTLLESLNSPEMVRIREDLARANQKSIETSVGWYYMLSAEDKYKAVEALCYLICKAEKEGTSHRGLMNTLNVYPEAFWCDFLIDVHNALYEYYDKRKTIRPTDKRR